MITASLNGENLPQINPDLINTPQENATDVVTLDGNIYTDFISVEQSWTFNYAYLTKAEYDAIRAIYDLQFTLFDYPLLSIPFFDVDEVPVRMYINEKNIWNNCGDIRGVQIIFRVARQSSESS